MDAQDARVRVEELQSTVDVVDGAALLTPPVLDHVVRAVLQALDRQTDQRATIRATVDLRSVVEQQRQGGG